MGTEGEAATAKKAKTSTRPKVGRPAGQRKKTEEPTVPAVLKTEKPVNAKSKNEAKSKDAAEAEPGPSKAESATNETGVLPAEKLSVKAPAAESAAEARPTAGMLYEALAAETTDILPAAELPQVEPAADWQAEHSRPWSFRSILFWVALFVVINLGLVGLFSVSHAPKPSVTPAAHTEPVPPAAPAVTAETPKPESSAPAVSPAPVLPVVAAPASPVTAAPVPAALAAVGPSSSSAQAAAVPAAPAPATSQATETAPQPQKDPRQLLSIIEKN